MPAAMRRDHPDLPKDTEQLTPEDYFANTEIVESEYSWLQHNKSVPDNTNIEDVTAASNASWAAFFASQEPNTSICPSIRTVLTLFTEDSKSVAVKMHAMRLIKQSISFLNPCQINVVAKSSHCMLSPKSTVDMAKLFWGISFCCGSWRTAY